MKRTLIVGNWKMNLSIAQASFLVSKLHKKIAGHRDIEVVLAPHTLALQPVSLQIDRRRFRLAAQNAYYKDEGAYTGEVSFTLLNDIVHYAIIGHSERRVYFNEDLDMIRDKVSACVRNQITPILCVGETSQEWSNGESKQVLHDQIVSALSDLTANEVAGMVIVYEPQWTITTFHGRPAKPDEVKSAVDFIRKQVSELYDDTAAKHLRVLYGGSVDEHSAGSYLRVEGCEGVLVGSASLNYQRFAAIVDSAYRKNRERADSDAKRQD
ncbi:triose-phosphate isomerase [Candidatus Parcubacteria bacterium]|nr:triose-phosphate isomerase [Candidatus Parcubacteria bacterium]